MSPVRRTVSPFATAPRDGTPFHILNTIRFNSLMERWEVLAHHNSEPERRVWRPLDLGCCEPSVWLRRVPLPYEIPDGAWFDVRTVRYLARRKTRLERARDWLASLLGRIARRLLPVAPEAAIIARWTASKWEVLPASADTHPEGGDALAAPFMSGAVGAAETPKG